jgi:hypothetical protein
MIINKISAVIAIATTLTGAVKATESGYVAHEWGTFTSVQGADGIQMSWRAAQVSELPGFVYNWKRPGLNRVGAIPGFGGKGLLQGQQRMETPVVYFYSDKEQVVDVSVEFPQGTITEWYPQANRIGPVIMNDAKAANAFGFGSSRVQWSGVKIIPSNSADSAARLPTDQSGSHYFAARATDSAMLNIRIPTAMAFENEKFLFYRGIGSFSTPLQATVAPGDALALTNNGPAPLKHLFLLTVNAGRGTFTPLESLDPGKSAAVPLETAEAGLPLNELAAKLGKAMAQGLEREGLFPREASAMVATWKDSWFTEDGTRVLYILPSAWADATLPMTLSPAPRERVRVMVGRAEIITPSVENGLRKSITLAREGDAGARRQTISQLKQLGRFAEPALRLACAHSTPDEATFGYKLLSEADPADSSNKSWAATLFQFFE